MVLTHKFYEKAVSLSKLVFPVIHGYTFYDIDTKTDAFHVRLCGSRQKIEFWLLKPPVFLQNWVSNSNYEIPDFQGGDLLDMDGKTEPFHLCEILRGNIPK